jgi:hypothetical protein
MSENRIPCLKLSRIHHLLPVNGVNHNHNHSHNHNNLNLNTTDLLTPGQSTNNLLKSDLKSKILLFEILQFEIQTPIALKTQWSRKKDLLSRQETR